MRIDDAVREDLSRIRHLNEAEIPHVNSVSEEGFLWFLENADHFRVCRDGDLLAGFLIGFLPGRPYDSLNYTWFERNYRSFFYVDRVVVAPDARGLGVGRLLYEDFANAGRGKAERLTCEVNIRPSNEGSLRFHHAFGFEEVGRQETEGGAKEVSLLAMDL